MKIRQINILYYFLLILSWILLGKFVFWKYASLPMLCLEMLYILWIICSQFVICHFLDKHGLKKDFISSRKYELSKTTFWVDEQKKELAVMCLGNPVKIQYVKVKDIDKAEVKIVKKWREPEESKFVRRVDMILCIKNVENRFAVSNTSGYSGVCVNMNAEGKKYVAETQEFIEYLMHIKER